MRYEIAIPKKVQKELSDIPKNFRTRITSALQVLADDPYTGKPLSGERKGQWSYRVWPYRIIYEIRKLELVVLLIKIGHRKDVYR